MFQLLSHFLGDQIQLFPECGVRNVSHIANKTAAKKYVKKPFDEKLCEEWYYPTNWKQCATAKWEEFIDMIKAEWGSFYAWATHTWTIVYAKARRVFEVIGFIVVVRYTLKVVDFLVKFAIAIL